jgi:hypothetical protein
MPWQHWCDLTVLHVDVSTHRKYQSPRLYTTGAPLHEDLAQLDALAASVYDHA